MAKVIREYMERLPTELDAAGLVRCDACKDRELDRAVALTMRELAPHIPPSVREVLFASMIRGMEADGIEAHPLSDRELERATGRELA